MAYDGFVVTAVTRELNDRLLNGKIDRIYQPAPDELVLHVRSGGGKYRLFISANPSHAGMYLTEEKESNPPNPPAFCMLLRKHLQSARVRSVQQVDSERIIQIDTDATNELGFQVRFRLITEIMGKHSNILLVNIETGKIVDCIKRLSLDTNRYRQTLPGVSYVAPPSHGKRSFFNLEKEDFVQAMQEAGRSPEKNLVSCVQGISPMLASELCFRASYKYGNDFKTEELWEELTAAVLEIREGELFPAVYRDREGTPKEFHALPITMYADNYESEPLSSISAACSTFFEGRESSNRMHQRSADLRHSINTSLSRMLRKKQNLQEDLLQAEDSEKYRLYGELLTAAIHLVPAGATSASVPNYYDGSTMDIPLDPRFSAAKNAQLYFKKYGKSKTAIVEKKKQLEENDLEIDYLESVLAMTEQASTSEDLDDIRAELIDNGYMKLRKSAVRKKKNKINPHRYTTSSGLEVLVGRNNIENDILTFRQAAPTDIWLHTKDFHGSHAILFTKGQEPSAEDIYEAAAIAAYHSKARQSANVPVDYVKVRYVKKPNGARPGYVIFTHNSTVWIDPALPKH